MSNETNEQPTWERYSSVAYDQYLAHMQAQDRRIASGQLPELSPIAQAYSTPFDRLHERHGGSDPDYALNQYRKGVMLANKRATIYVAHNGVWSATIPHQIDSIGDGPSFLSTYETLGHHACTSYLIQGWIDGRACIVDYRSSSASAPSLSTYGPDNTLYAQLTLPEVSHE